MKYLLFFAAPIVLIGCGESSTNHDHRPPRTITATDALTFRGADGTHDEWPIDLDRAIVQAITQADDGTWTIVPGMGTSGGVVVVDDVPAGDGYLRVDYHDSSPEPRPRNEYFWIGSDDDLDLDLGVWRAGRADADRAWTAPTDLQLDVTGLSPWQPGADLAVVYTPNLGFVNVFQQDIPEAVSGMPAASAVATELHIDWATAVFGPLASADRGDRSYLMQFRFRQVQGVIVGAPVRAVALPQFDQHDGEATVVAAALAEPAPLRVRLAMDRPAFDALRPDLGRDVGAALGRGFSISSSPSVVAQEFSPQSVPAELVVLDDGALDGAGPADLGDLDVASPFPVETVYGQFVSVYPVTVARDDGLVAQAQAEVGVITNAIPTQAAPAAPIIGPVRAVTVAGHDAASAPLGVGLTPEIAWQPPALGTPVEYEVRVLAPGGADPTYDFLWYPAAIFHVPGDRTSLTLPPELLRPDWPYAIAIRAVTHALPADVRATHPRHLALPYGWADTITPAFKP